VLEDPGELAAWALAAIRASENAASKPKRMAKSGKRKPRKAGRKKRPR
jgi:hypothetical protein